MRQQGDPGEIRNPRATRKDLDSGDENTFLQLLDQFKISAAPNRTKMGTVGRKRLRYPDPFSGTRKRTEPSGSVLLLDGLTVSCNSW